MALNGSTPRCDSFGAPFQKAADAAYRARHAATHRRPSPLSTKKTAFTMSPGASSPIARRRLAAGRLNSEWQRPTGAFVVDDWCRMRRGQPILTKQRSATRREDGSFAIDESVPEPIRQALREMEQAHERRSACIPCADPAPEGVGTDICPVCFEEMGEAGRCEWPACCGHAFCTSCLDSCLRRNVQCPLCRAEAPSEAQQEAQKTAMFDALTSLDTTNLTEAERRRLGQLLTRRHARRFLEEGGSMRARTRRVSSPGQRISPARRLRGLFG